MYLVCFSSSHRKGYMGICFNTPVNAKIINRRKSRPHRASGRLLTSLLSTSQSPAVNATSLTTLATLHPAQDTLLVINRAFHRLSTDSYHSVTSILRSVQLH